MANQITPSRLSTGFFQGEVGGRSAENLGGRSYQNWRQNYAQWQQRQNAWQRNFNAWQNKFNQQQSKWQQDFDKWQAGFSISFCCILKANKIPK